MSVRKADAQAAKSVEQYRIVMAMVRQRLDIIENLSREADQQLLHFESAALHGRKVIEGIAIGCLVAMENGLDEIPRDARGQWNAKIIFMKLKGHALNSFPNPSILRAPTRSEIDAVGTITPKAVVEGRAEYVIAPSELVRIYESLHGWLHEVNPYTGQSHHKLIAERGGPLWTDLKRVDLFIQRHFIEIGRQAMFCTLRDSVDGATKVIGLTRHSNAGLKSVR